MASTASYNCKRCGSLFTARTADRARGWARFCSKSCKAIKQTQKRGRRPNSRIIEGPYTEGERAGEELFYANFSNEENSDI